MSDLPIIELSIEEFENISDEMLDAHVYPPDHFIKYHGIYITEEGKFYIENGLYHRIDGPAQEWNDGRKVWAINGSLHRLDGPAVEAADGSVQYWIDRNCFKTQEEYEIAAYLYKNELNSYE